jgi:hypothetical protein
LNDLSDVDTTGVLNGMFLRYDANTNLYVMRAITTLDGGTF